MCLFWPGTCQQTSLLSTSRASMATANMTIVTAITMMTAAAAKKTTATGSATKRMMMMMTMTRTAVTTAVKNMGHIITEHRSSKSECTITLWSSRIDEGWLWVWSWCFFYFGTYYLIFLWRPSGKLNIGFIRYHFFLTTRNHLRRHWGKLMVHFHIFCIFVWCNSSTEAKKVLCAAVLCHILFPFRHLTHFDRDRQNKEEKEEETNSNANIFSRVV